ncbi:MAG: AMP-binding protein [Spirochaetales bacterium]
MKRSIPDRIPWAFLDAYRGTKFNGEWPTLPEMFKITVDRFGDRPCFTAFEEVKLTQTYSQALKNIESLSQWMLSKGIKKGDHIAVSGKNSPEWAIVYLAALFSGAIIIPIDYALHENEIDNLLAAATPKMLFIDEERYDYYKKSSKKFDTYSLSAKNTDTYVYNLVTDKEYTAQPVEESDTAAILFTSGTTGTPKGVMLTHKNFVSCCYIAQTNLKIFETDVFYALLPIHHSYTMLAVFIEALSVGSEIVFAKSMVVSRMLKELKAGKITMLLGVPLLFNKLLAGILRGIREKGVVVYGIIKGLIGFSCFCSKTFRFNPGKKIFKSILQKASISTIRIAISGGGPLASSVVDMYQGLGIDFVQGYGLTETSPIIALNPKEKFKVKSVGRFFAPHMEMSILDPDERGIGEIIVKGPMVMKGYYNMEAETKAMFTDDGWFKTGDLGYLDKENYLYLAGRAKNMIVTEGGKNVFPEEIENKFQLYTDIEQITVQGYIMNESTKSEGIEALVYPSDDLYKRLNIIRGSAEDGKAVYDEINTIITVTNKELATYARISKITVLDEALEMTTTKKVKRVYKK